MSAIDDVFNALLFGSGALLGLIIFMVLILTVTIGLNRKEVYALFMFISLFLTIEYLQNIAVNDYFMWFSLIAFLLTIFLFYGAVKRGK